jgi:hypothetical protein
VTLKRWFRCLQQVDSHYDLAVATFHFLTGMWCTSSLHLQKKRSNDVLADSMGTILHMLALRSAPRHFVHSFSHSHSGNDHFEGKIEAHLVVEYIRANDIKILSNEIIEVWNLSMQDANVNDAVSARFVSISKSAFNLQTPCIHSSLCFAFSLRLLFDNRATEALDICEYWLQDLETTRSRHPESFVWYRIGLSACKALACSILSQGVKAREILKKTQDELETYNLPGLRAYISFLGLLAAGALCHKRQDADKTAIPSSASIWKNPNLWKSSAVVHMIRFHSTLIPDISTPVKTKRIDAKPTTSKLSERLHKRRLSNLFEDLEVCERESFLKNSELMHLIVSQYTSFVAGLTGMKHSVPAELVKCTCVFADLWENMLSWKSELASVIVSVSVQRQQF